MSAGHGTRARRPLIPRSSPVWGEACAGWPQGARSCWCGPKFGSFCELPLNRVGGLHPTHSSRALAAGRASTTHGIPAPHGHARHQPYRCLVRIGMNAGALQVLDGARIFSKAQGTGQGGDLISGRRYRHYARPSAAQLWGDHLGEMLREERRQEDSHHGRGRVPACEQYREEGG
jgi:hypothetical protein